MTKMLVCGGRKYDDVPWMWMHLDSIAIERRVEWVIDGGQWHLDKTRGIVGADYWANQWAKARGMKNSQYFADWLEQGNAAGPIRNRRMITEGKPDFVVAFPGGSGTASTVGLARAAGIDVIHIGPRA
jgi:hypothetical protein